MIAWVIMAMDDAAKMAQNSQCYNSIVTRQNETLKIDMITTRIYEIIWLASSSNIIMT